MFYAWKPLEFRWHERATLDALYSHLPLELQRIMSDQMAALTHVIRQAGGRDVNLYRATGRLFRKPDWSGVRPFPWKDPERLLGSVRLKSGATEILANVWTANAYLFSIEYSGDPAGVSNSVTTFDVVEVNVP